MSKYTFTCEHYKYDLFTGDKYGVESKTVQESTPEDLDELIKNFELFLRGCGFYFEGQLDIVREDFPENICTSETTEEYYNCPVCKIDMETMNGHKCYDKNCPRNS
jgi:hypothetical protein